ncbi:hypothetical protein FB45DRAFT_6316 [Roridomyces roridus]|uniref:Uncharacterized protein n=1 Tax=Roridomyces roridus TaxID=1738132 RepID=A0AAD7CIR8_9AGAR|nr:hypothetical protein FB45DRAFT_6316 [Roridomyces roridus]
MIAVLPCAYLRVSMYLTQAEILDGIRRPDGTLAVLSAIDQRVCILARASMVQTQWASGNPFGWIADSTLPENCANPSSCRELKSRCFQRNVVAGVFAAFPFDSDQAKQLGLCSVCTEDGNTKFVAGRKKMWEALPSYFELPPWGDLKNDL